MNIPFLKQSSSHLADTAALLFGAAVYAVGFTAFLLPNTVLLGGATGFATVLRLLFGLPVGVMTVLLNLPLLLIAYAMLGRGAVLRSVLGVLALSLFLDLLAWLPPMTEERLIAAVLGGAMTGVGSAIQLSHGFTSGGSDLAAYLLHHRLKRLSTGTLVSLIDGGIVLASALLLSDLAALPFSVLAILSYSFSLDFFLSYTERTRLALIICPAADAEPLSERIGREVGRGVTVLEAKGGYTGAGRAVLLCAMHAREESFFLLTVRGACPSAFLILLSAPAVFGNRFRQEKLDKP